MVADFLRFPREEFADSLEQPDPVSLHYLIGNRAVNAETGDSDGGSGMAQKDGEDGAAVPREGARRRHAASPTRSA